ncbi:MAG TPA: response regulator [Polyangiaceae bacterium]|nr:response regulator [Polyangiaceae bacterium]
MNSPLSVLVIEDEVAMRRLLQVTLSHHGYRLLEATTAREGTYIAQRRQPDLVLLDLGLPDASGVEVTDTIRRTSEVPIIVISARDAEDQKISALDAGADDYITKPFAPGELLARMRVAIRRSIRHDHVLPAGAFCVGELAVDFDARRVRVGRREVHLTPTEYKLLGVLIASAGKVVTHRQLLHEVWGPGSVDRVEYLRVFMKQLRSKLESRPGAPEYLLTEPAVGYRLHCPAADE